MKRSLAWAAVALVPVVAIAAPGAAMFRGGPAHLGVYDSAAPSLRSIKWRFAVKGKIVSSPAVLGGVVYFGSGDRKVYALRASDGSQIWRFATKGAVASSPAVAGGSVFVSSLDGNVYAIDAASGAKRWAFATQGERRFTAPGIHGIQPRTEMMPDPYDVFLSSPAVYDGVVYVGSGDRNVYAIDAASGSLRWKFATGDVVHASPAVADGTVYVGSWDRYFYALDARSGAVKWKYLTGDDPDIHNQIGINSSAAVAGGIVYFGCRDAHLYALDARDGTLVWRHDDHGSWVVGSPAVADDTVYATTSDEHTFFALDAKTGAERFHVAYGTFAFSSPSIAGGVAYFGTFDGRLYAIDTRAGSVIARFSTDGSQKNLPAHLDAQGNLDLRTIYPDFTLDGVMVGMARLYELGAILGSPAIEGGVLYVGSADGVMYAIA